MDATSEPTSDGGPLPTGSAPQPPPPPLCKRWDAPPPACEPPSKSGCVAIESGPSQHDYRGLGVPDGWHRARGGWQRDGRDDYHLLRALLQDFEELFIALHGRRPTPTECAADSVYNSLYARYAVAKQERSRLISDDLDGSSSVTLSAVNDHADGDGIGASPEAGLWTQLLEGGMILGKKRPRAELEAAAFPARLHTRPRTFATIATQTSP